MPKSDVILELKKKKEERTRAEIISSFEKGVSQIQSEIKETQKQIEVTSDNLQTGLDENREIIKSLDTNVDIVKEELINELKITELKVSNFPREIGINNFPEQEIKRDWLGRNIKAVGDGVSTLIEVILSLQDTIFKVDISKHERKENALAVRVVEDKTARGGGSTDLSRLGTDLDEINANLEEINESIGNIDLGASDPLIQYQTTDLDTANAIKYVGYVDKDENWFIKKITATEIRFAKGTSSYTTNWTNRAGLSYDYFYNIF